MAEYTKTLKFADGKGNNYEPEYNFRGIHFELTPTGQDSLTVKLSSDKLSEDELIDELEAQELDGIFEGRKFALEY